MVNNKYIEGVFHSKWLSKFINQWFFSGKVYKIEKILYLSLFLIKNKLKCCPMYLFFETLEKIKPVIGLRIYRQKRRKFDKIVAIPYAMNSIGRYKKAIFWLVTAIKLRTKEKKLSSKIFLELKDISINNSGEAIRKKKEYYKHAIHVKATKKFKW